MCHCPNYVECKTLVTYAYIPYNLLSFCSTVLSVYLLCYLSIIFFYKPEEMAYIFCGCLRGTIIWNRTAVSSTTSLTHPHPQHIRQRVQQCGALVCEYVSSFVSYLSLPHSISPALDGTRDMRDVSVCISHNVHCAQCETLPHARRYKKDAPIYALCDGECIQTCFLRLTSVWQRLSCMRTRHFASRFHCSSDTIPCALRCAACVWWLTGNCESCLRVRHLCALCAHGRIP